MTAEFYNRAGCLLERREGLVQTKLPQQIGDWLLVAEEGDKIVFRDSSSEG